MGTSFKPLGDRALVRRLTADEMSPGGVFIPEAAREQPARGRVIAVGPGARDADGAILPVGFSVGDTILFGRFSGQEIRLDGEDLLIVSEKDVHGIIVDDVGTVARVKKTKLTAV